MILLRFNVFTDREPWVFNTPTLQPNHPAVIRPITILSILTQLVHRRKNPVFRRFEKLIGIVQNRIGRVQKKHQFQRLTCSRNFRGSVGAVRLVVEVTLASQVHWNAFFLCDVRRATKCAGVLVIILSRSEMGSVDAG